MIGRLSMRRRLIAGGLALAVVAGALVIGLMVTRGTAPAEARLQAAASLRPLGPTDELIAATRERVAALPNDAAALALLGAAYLQLARETGDPANYARAEAAFDDALRIDGRNVEALIGRGSLALARHEFSAALETGEAARAINDTIPRVHGLIADAQVELGRYDEAVATVQVMVDMRPDLASYSRVAYLRELHGDLDGAIDAMQRAVAAGGPAVENTEYVRVQLGNLYFAAGNLPAAERTYTESLTHIADYPYAIGGMARVRAAQGELDTAIALYDRAATRIPLPELVIALGEALEAAGRTEEAADRYELVGAIQRLLAANGVRNDLELAAFAAEHGPDPDAAVTMARAAYAERPTVFAADALAWALHAAGDDQTAARYADEALRLDTSSSLLLYHAGVIAACNGATEVARDRLQRALALNPHFSPLHAPRAAAELAALDP